MTNGLAYAPSARLQALQSKHLALAHQIDRETKRPSVNPLYLRQLKTMKLRVKDEIEDARRRA